MHYCTATARTAALGLTLIALAACERPQPTELTLPTGASAAKRGKDDPGSAALGTKTVVVGGLTNPRGLTFDKDGAIYVAEAGTGGTTSTVGQCLQVPAPGGPVFSGRTGRIRVSPTACARRSSAASPHPSTSAARCLASMTSRSSGRSCTRCSTRGAGTACPTCPRA